MRGHRTAAAGDALALAWRRPGEPGCEYGVKGCGGQGREMRRAKVMPGRQKKGPGQPSGGGEAGRARGLQLVVDLLGGLGDVVEQADLLLVEARDVTVVALFEGLGAFLA